MIPDVLSAAALGMVAYAVVAIGGGLADLVRGPQLEVWADLARMLFGIVLIVAAACVRVLMPGGLAMAIGALLALQALAIHHAAHLYGDVMWVGPSVLGTFAATLVALAYLGARRI